jgi:lipopolysaccharide export system protein LptC
MIGFSKLLIGAIVIALITVVIVMPLMNREETGMRIMMNQLPLAQDTDEKPRMENPRFEGVDGKNRPFTVTAKEAIQEDITTVNLIELKANITLEEGKWLAISAQQGVLQIPNKKMLLSGMVKVNSAEGEEFTTDQILVNLATGDTWGPKPVQARAAMGSISADSFQFSMFYKAIRFSKNVKLIIYPQ